MRDIKFAGKPRAIVYGGTYWPSIVSLSREMGVNQSTVQKALSRGMWRGRELREAGVDEASDNLTPAQRAEDAAIRNFLSGIREGTPPDRRLWR